MYLKYVYIANHKRSATEHALTCLYPLWIKPILAILLKQLSFLWQFGNYNQI